ncbi:DUF6156 family protein [Methylogaea oryzae]|uniref:Uncharacterized protein n=1 Tax=Methylogaea oryzae TaxID=1295382 RepID=A0A8D5AIW6_9GAMM|nr:DUF6156 family protein [Methylogaea oryzae]BBL70169.1 hypothetical protein MoryE10_07750 [Methylogaea oryzae]
MNEQPAGACRYFVTYTGVKLPFKLVNPLEPGEVENRNTYFRGYFDGDGRLTALQSVIYGEVELEHRYQYHGDGTLRQAEITDADGETNLLRFDDTGTPLGA